MSLNTHLLRRVLTDGETGLANEAFFELEIEREIERAQRYHVPLGMVRIRCPDARGDEIFRVAQAVTSRLRRSDFLARTGSDEITVLLTHTPRDRAQEVTRRLERVCDELVGDDVAGRISVDYEEDIQRFLPSA